MSQNAFVMKKTKYLSDISVGLAFVGCDSEIKMYTGHGNAEIVLLDHLEVYVVHPTINSAVDIVIAVKRLTFVGWLALLVEFGA